MPRGAILFDFDGTLVDTRQASWEVFAETNERFDLGVDDRDAFFRIFQANFYESMDALSPDKERIRQAKEHFMAALKDRYQPSLIPGIVDVIRVLTPGYTLAVVSSNSMPVIRRVLNDAGIATCFSHVFSGEVETSKSAIIRRFMADQSYASLRHCSPSYVDQVNPRLVNDSTFIVTDTVGDVEEAQRVGIRAVGVCWGMHDQASLLEAGAETVMIWPQELIAFFGAATDDVPDTCRIDISVPTAATNDIDRPGKSGSCQCGGEAEDTTQRLGPAEIRSINRLEARRVALPVTADAPAVKPVTSTDQPAASTAHERPWSTIDPELVEALRVTAVR